MTWQTEENLTRMKQAGTFEGAVINSIRYGRWPDPFRNMLKRIDVLACEDTWQAQFTMYALAFGHWFWSNYIPGPWELTRKTFAGSYRCGFYRAGKVRSPLNIVWRDGRTARALGEIIRPVATGAFWVWNIGSKWEALKTWESLQIKQELCDENQNSSLMRDSEALFTTTGHKEGPPALGAIIYDPKSRMNENITLCEYGFPCRWTAHAYGYFVSLSAQLNNCSAKIDTGSGSDPWIPFGNAAPFEALPFDVHIQGEGSAAILQLQMAFDVVGGALLKARFHCVRFTCNITDLNEPDPGLSLPVPEPEKPWELCEAFSPPYV